MRILVLCTGNSCRSQMAQGYLQRFAGDRAEVFSAGIETHGVNPRAIAVMKEDGIDISHHTSHNVDEYRDIAFDHVITVCDNARERCPWFPSSSRMHHQDFLDPAKATGTEEEIIAAFRVTRDRIRDYCRGFVTEQLREVRVVLADRLLRLIEHVSLDNVQLPWGVHVLDPLRGENSTEVRRILSDFHQRFYHDDRPRLLMLGINPGRLGAGSTGLCFTDTKRCESELGIPVTGFRTHEPSSDFFYRMIAAAGGPEAFYSRVVVQAVCPLGFTRMGPKGTPVNLNYYDDPALQRAITPFVITWLRDLIDTGLRSDVVFCIGAGKNLAFLEAMNTEHRFFERIVPLEHPRFIMQYRAKRIGEYVGKYVKALHEAG